jgi:hypothetical protein
MKFESLERSHPNIFKARVKSTDVLNRLRANMPDVSGVSVVANGSLARGEVTSQSDFDAYPLYNRGAKAAAEQLFATVQGRAGLKEFAAEGAFGVAAAAEAMSRNIGGQGDDNHRFTRRMLLILESTPIGNRSVYDAAVERVISRYINDEISDKQIGRFLLNDIIRFYRQMCVDFEFKTVEQTKPWGLRYAKLIFSRKIIYYSGVIMCAELADKKAAEKRTCLEEMVNLPPIDRLLSVLGESIIPALTEYDNFLAHLDHKQSRDDLAQVKMSRETHTNLFKEVKTSGHRYSGILVDVIRKKYPVDHPIRESLIV